MNRHYVKTITPEIFNELMGDQYTPERAEKWFKEFRRYLRRNEWTVKMHKLPGECAFEDFTCTKGTGSSIELSAVYTEQGGAYDVTRCRLSELTLQTGDHLIIREFELALSHFCDEKLATIAIQRNCTARKRVN